MNCRLLIISIVYFMPALLVAEDLSDQIRRQLSKEEVTWAEQTLNWDLLRKFYQPHFQSVWIHNRQASERAQQWIKTIHAAENEGLEPKHYHLDEILQYQYPEDSEQLIWLELLLTDAFLLYSQHVRYGRLEPASVDPDWHIRPLQTDPVSMLRKTLQAGNFIAALQALPPRHEGYLRLREALARYRQLNRKKDFPYIPHSPKLYWGSWHDHVLILRRRLVLSGDLSPRQVKEARFFDQTLKQAVEHFQRRHGLKDDGIVGGETFTRLNMPMREHIQQIKLNMERWRWLPGSLGDRYITVNTASYQMHVMVRNNPRLAMRVITGTPERPTPVVAGSMQNLIINPYWNIPKKIIIEDIIPRQLENPAYIKSRGIRVFRGSGDDAEEIDPQQVDWRSINPEFLPFVLRQEPGPDNSLGNIKFPFLNNFSIYLHDTPQRKLFAYSKRAFSSGCVRVEDPVQLASYLLNGEKGWSRDKLLQTISEGKTLTVALPEPIPIYLVYWTVWVGVNNTVYFQKDIYDRDRHMLECGQ